MSMSMSTLLPSILTRRRHQHNRPTVNIASATSVLSPSDDFSSIPTMPRTLVVLPGGSLLRSTPRSPPPAIKKNLRFKDEVSEISYDPQEEIVATTASIDSTCSKQLSSAFATSAVTAASTTASSFPVKSLDSDVESEDLMPAAHLTSRSAVHLCVSKILDRRRLKRLDAISEPRDRFAETFNFWSRCERGTYRALELPERTTVIALSDAEAQETTRTAAKPLEAKTLMTSSTTLLLPSSSAATPTSEEKATTTKSVAKRRQWLRNVKQSVQKKWFKINSPSLPKVEELIVEAEEATEDLIVPKSDIPDTTPTSVHSTGSVRVKSSPLNISPPWAGTLTPVHLSPHGTSFWETASSTTTFVHHREKHYFSAKAEYAGGAGPFTRRFAVSPTNSGVDFPRDIY
jgi:hypothetical protein